MQRHLCKDVHKKLMYKVAKTHRMPGRAASGGALAPEPAARHRGRTPGPTDFSEFIFLFLFFPLYFDIGRLPPKFWNRTTIHREWMSHVTHTSYSLITCDIPLFANNITKSDLRSGRCPIWETIEMESDHYQKRNHEVRSQKNGKKHHDVRSQDKAENNVRFQIYGKWELGCTMHRGSGPTPVARGGSGAKLAARPVASHFPQKSH